MFGLFGSKKINIAREIGNRVGPIFTFRNLEPIAGLPPEAYYSDHYVLGFYSASVLMLTLAGYGINPASENPRYNVEDSIFIEAFLTKELFGARATAISTLIIQLMNRGNIVDEEYKRGVINGKKWVYLLVGLKPLDKDPDIENAQRQFDAGLLASLGPATVADYYLGDQFTAYVTKKYYSN